MSSITFDQLLPIYRNTVLVGDSMEGTIRITDEAMLDTLRLLESDDRAFEDSGIAIRNPVEEIVLGGMIKVELSPPRGGLGILARNLDALLLNPTHRIKEPRRYYLISERFAYNDPVIPDTVTKYRAAVCFVDAVSAAAALVDKYSAEATFLGPTRLRVPILYKTAELQGIATTTVEKLQDFVFEKIHKDQKTAILASVAVEMCRHQLEDERFAYLLKHMRELVAKSHDGYALFASEFSYDKIKSKTEEAIGDYTNRIHKTFHDIQNQVMGVPVATVIVATQLKVAANCGVEFWSNLAISIGATFFVMLLSVAIYNQFLTLANISGDITRQHEKLDRDYASVAQQFKPLYRRLSRRVSTHRWILGLILVVCWVGVGLTWYVYARLTAAGFSACTP